METVEITMTKLEMDLLTSDHTEVLREVDYKWNAPHRFIVRNVETKEGLASVHFQEGPMGECGVNGVCNEDLIAMVLCRLQCFQDSDYHCKENEMAIEKLQEALLWLRKRTMGRQQRGVINTSKL